MEFHGTPAHRSRHTVAYLNANVPELIEPENWPPNSPDLNSVDYTLRWLPVSQRIQFRIAALVWRCLLGTAPAYLCELCCPVSAVVGRRVLRSASSGELLVPRARTSTR